MVLIFLLTSCQASSLEAVNPTSDELRNAFLLTVAAGLSTVIGATIAFCLQDRNLQREQCKFLAGSLSFAGSVMVYVSFVELWAECITQYEHVFDDPQIVHLYTSFSFFLGIFLGYLCSKLVQHFEMGHSHGDVLCAESINEAPIGLCNINESNEQSLASDSEIDLLKVQRKTRLYRTGVITAISIALHNFPEGLVTFLAALANWKAGVSIAFAIAMHNIPEGVSISVPYFYASESRWKAFGIAFLSGIAEPIGALIGWAILGSMWGYDVFGFMFGLTAGIMVFISFNQLFPLARKNDPEDKVCTLMMFVGMIVMDVSILIAE